MNCETIAQKIIMIFPSRVARELTLERPERIQACV